MSERSVAEIIGWHHLWDPYGDVTDAWTRDGRGWEWEERYGDTPTVDDLFAWLRGRGFMWFARSSDDNVSLNIEPAGYYDDALGAPFVAPTLLAALEAAVRAVAETPNAPAQ